MIFRTMPTGALARDLPSRRLRNIFVIFWANIITHDKIYAQTSCANTTTTIQKKMEMDFHWTADGKMKRGWPNKNMMKVSRERTEKPESVLEPHPHLLLTDKNESI